MKKALLFISIIILTGSVSVFGEYDPPAGTEDVLEFVSPYSLASGAMITSEKSPYADIFNPAASGARQRIVLDLNYIALVGFGNDRGWGHLINLGNSIPTKAGVFTWSGHFLKSSLRDANLGTLGGLNFSFSKDVFKELLIGIGLRSNFGRNGSFDWGLGADLGFLHKPGDLGFMKDFKWGVVIQNMGKGFSPVDGKTSYPAPFTLVGGMTFSAVRTDNVILTFSTDVGTPSFQNLYVKLGSELSIRDFIMMQIGSKIDIHKLSDPDFGAKSLLPSFGLTFKIKPGRKKENKNRFWKKTEIEIQSSAAPVRNGAWAIGTGVTMTIGNKDKDPPEVKIEYPEKQYISPNNDGDNDELSFPVDIKDSRFVMGYTFRIVDKNNKIIREYVNKDDRPIRKNLKNLFKNFFSKKKEVPLPDRLTWDGKSQEGTLVKDGEYRFVIEAWDDNDNKGITEERVVIVDKTAPEISVTPPPYLIFSPNDDGNKDVLSLHQEGSEEEVWEAVITDSSGDVVKKYVWKNSKPRNINWDGRDNEGKTLPDGVYEYQITSTDRAKNKNEKRISNIILSTIKTPVSLSISSSHFSPNGDGVKDKITFKPKIPIKKGIEKWELSVKDSSGKDVRKFTGKGNVPQKIDFNGKDGSLKKLQEGVYFGKLNVLYINGNNPSSESPKFELDVTPPSATVKTDYQIFSPNNDGKKDFIKISQTTSPEIKWTGIISRTNGKSVRVYTWINKADPSFSWDGRDTGGLLPDGKYNYHLEAVDAAGNKGKSRTVTFEINTEKTPVFISTQYEAFSPNGDGVKDRMKIITQAANPGNIESFLLKINSSSGKTLKSIRGKSNLPKTIFWKGLSDDSRKAPDGVYYAELKVLYKNGNEPVAKTKAFILDTVFPVIELDANTKLFSPDSDGKKDSVSIKPLKCSKEKVWEGKLLTTSGKLVKSFFWKDRVKAFSWNGTDDAGNKVPDGDYKFMVSSRDLAGNYAEKIIDPLTVDNRPTRAFVTVSGKGFSPNSDGYMDTLVIKNYITLKEGIKSWRINLVDGNKKIRKTFSGKGNTIPGKIVWDGKDSTGKIYEGSYYADIKVVYKKGNEPGARSTSFILDVTPPEVRVLLSPKPFSPDNDGVDDELSIELKVKDRSSIKSWNMDIDDPKGNIFYKIKGRNKPSDRIRWNGYSSTGELVLSAEDYPYEFKIRDIFGNKSVTRGKIPVDILVIRDGNRLKIRISNINFAPNSPELIQDDPEIRKKNERILKRLAEILKKYKTYKIGIEGHAVRVYWADPARAKIEEEKELLPLSKKRANTVKNALIKLRINRDRITISGLGGTEPVVPHSDLVNRWKNRRVEFILIK